MAVNTTHWDTYFHLMEREIVPACGCTEPIAVALAAANARALAGSPVSRVAVRVSRNILKNAMSVTIPGTSLCGVDCAAALGTVYGDPTKRLEVLSGVSEQEEQKAVAMVRAGMVEVSLDPTPEPLYIHVTAYGPAHTGVAAICSDHSNVVLQQRDGEVLLKKDASSAAVAQTLPDGVCLRDVYDFAMQVPVEKLTLIRQAVALNTAISQDGLEHRYGLELGRQMKQRPGRGSDQLRHNAIMRTLGAIDARMAGAPLTVMANSGSGNQGITATVPVWSAACDLDAGEEKMLRAVTLSHLTAIYIKEHLERLSSFCGAIVAAIGASSAITYLLGGSYEQIECTVVNMVAAITGMICDGAKSGCSLKVSAALQTGFDALYLSLDGIRVSGAEGVVAESVEQTIDNLGQLTTEGMKQTDQTILDIMLQKMNKH